jgi:transcriptional regulator with XRE-family HTH domain
MTEDWLNEIERRLEELGWTDAELCRRAGVNGSMMHNLRTLKQRPRIDTLNKLRKALGLPTQSLIDGARAPRLQVEINGVTRGAGMWAEVPNGHGRIIPLDMLGEDSISVEVCDDSLVPTFRRGDVLVGRKYSSAFVDNFINTEVICQAADGKRYVCLLQRGGQPGRYDLRSIDSRGETVRDARIDWAAPVSLILRATR